MIRAMYFDFYGVWLPNRFADYIALAEQKSPELAVQLREVYQKYALGEEEPEFLANSIKFKLDMPAVTVDEFTLAHSDIAAGIIDFMRSLHGHFLKLGMLANLGKQEYNLLLQINAQYELFEAITGPVTTGAPLMSEETIGSALRQIGEPPESVLVVTGDQQFQQYAASLGMQTVIFAGVPNLQAYLAQALA